ncbi:putative V-type ATP synthase subunit A [Fadolivirus algeromassiliense]|jgi:hypothetical protein|uniref:V-type ATP synthase subunit A n=1 Tax=Fadolivirus FV1/VV64 TaxID=3070911 RepID=A0A7D3V596_9VIRU|nr:putative V-type ATP synthase subunit A [Fadolivirus algeromassiliense]QKF93735.1 putative V-type ATP synthase subunit A [Fadolivirus FV1/VV64]
MNTNPSDSKLEEEIKNLTPDDIKDIEQEPGDVNDIVQEVPNKQQLDQLKQMIDSMPREKVMELLANLQQSNGFNPVNPNGNTYSSTNKQSMLKNRLKQKIRQKQMGRMPNSAKEHEKEKMMKKMQEQMKKSQPETPSTTGSSEPHQCEDGCTHTH